MANSILAKMAVEITANTAQFNKSLTQTNQKLDSFSKGISNIGKSLIAGLGLYEIGRGIIDVTAKFQKFEAILTNTLGNSSAAQKALRDIEAFAQNTPFQVDEVTAAYVRWANQGLDPTIDRMGKLGDVASSLGAGFEQTAEAFKDLMVGQTKRIEEVGISATQANGKIQLSFKGVNIEIEKNSAGVQKALDVYSQLNGVLGTSDAISKTLGGRISNLKDSWDLLLKTIGEANSGPLFTTINVLTRLTQGLAYMGIQAKITAKGLGSLSTLEFEKVFNFGETESLKKISDVIKEINSLNSSSFFKNINENKTKFIELLVKEGESQEDVLILWQKYVDLRLRSANNEDDAIAKKRELVKAVVEEVKAVKEVNLERQKAQARASGVNISGPTVAGFDMSQLSFSGADNSGIVGIQNALTAATERANEAQQKQIEIIMAQREGWANLGATMSDTIAQTIAGGQPLLQSLSKITATIINQLEQITLARMVANSSKFGIAGILAAAAGFGIVKGLFNRLGKDNSVSGYSNTSYGGRMQPIGVTVYSRQRGTDLVSVGTEESRIRKRTRG